MLHIKDTINLAEIKTLFNAPDKPLSLFFDFLEGKKSNKALNHLDELKRQGFEASRVMIMLLLFPFLDAVNVHSFFQSANNFLSYAQKDVYYRLKNNSNVDWRRFLLAIAKESRHLSAQSQRNPSSPTCFILDDTLLRHVGYAIEGIGKVWDHVTHSMVLGFKCLLLGYWNGKVFIPVDFSLHREKGKRKDMPYGIPLRKFHEQFSKDREEQSPGAVRRNELDRDKISNGIKMLKRAVKNGFCTDYLLTDSWFFCESLLSFVHNCKGIGHLIAQCKMDMRLYQFQDKNYNCTQLNKKLGNKWVRSRKLKIRYKEVVVIYKGIAVKLFFTRLHGSKKNRLLLSSDLRLSFPKAFEIYSIRWTIEVFFKEGKQLVGLGKCQSTDFDAQIADTALAMVRHSILAINKQTQCYQTLGGLFKDIKNKTTELILSQKIWGLVVKLLTELTELFEIDIEEVMEKMMDREEYIRRIMNYLHNQADSDPKSSEKTTAIEKAA